MQASFVALLVALAVPRSADADAARPKRLALLPLAVANVSAADAATLGDLIAERAARYPQLEVISSADINTLLGLERVRDAVGCDNVSCAVEIGGALDADLMIAGRTGAFGASRTINLVLFDVRSSKTIARGLETVESVEALGGAVGRILDKLLGPAPAGEPETPVDLMPDPHLPLDKAVYLVLRRLNAGAYGEAEAPGAVAGGRGVDSAFAHATARTIQQRALRVVCSAAPDSVKVAALDSYLEAEPSRGREDFAREYATTTRDQLLNGRWAYGITLLDAGYLWPGGFSAEVARWKWMHTQVSAATGYYNKQDGHTSWGLGFGGFGLATHPANTGHELGFLIYPFSFGKYETNSGVSGTALVLTKAYYRYYLTTDIPVLWATHFELGAVGPAAWQTAAGWYARRPPVGAYLSIGLGSFENETRFQKSCGKE